MHQALLIGLSVGQLSCDGKLEVLLRSRFVSSLEFTSERWRSCFERNEGGGERTMDAWEEGEGSWGRRGGEGRGGREEVSFVFFFHPKKYRLENSNTHLMMV